MMKGEDFMAERLTREQMAQKYPNTWLGLVNIKYANDDGVTLEAADIIYTDKTEDELFEMQLDGIEGVISWYTNDNGLPLGVAGVL